uniref:Putative secreted peptide n=1 Tax=Anopheles braziliensis TaxID=58242 RepID=A0A2M3ZMN2_9DIPT
MWFSLYFFLLDLLHVPKFYMSLPQTSLRVSSFFSVSCFWGRYQDAIFLLKHRRLSILHRLLLVSSLSPYFTMSSNL